MMTARVVGMVVATACVALGCGGGDDDDATDGGTQGDGATTTDGSSGGDGTTGVDSATSAALSVSGFDVHSTFGGYFLICDPTGTCYGNQTNIYKLAPNATMYTIIGNTTNGLISSSPASIHRDAAGNLYTNACSGIQGVYKLPAGGTTWAIFGTGLTSANSTSCNWNTITSDAAGNIYVGFALLNEMYKVPAAGGAWTTTGTSGVVRAATARGNDIYVAGNGGVLRLAAGTTAWTPVGTGHPGGAINIAIDGAGNIYTTNTNGTGAGVAKLAAGATNWVLTTDFGVITNASNPVFDGAGNGYIMSRDGGASVYSLRKLAAGTLAWTKLFDTTTTDSENCNAMANDNIGHLILQCNTVMLRSRP